MGTDYDNDAELRSIDMWVCKTCGKCWPVNGKTKNWTAEDAEKAARTCCSKNSPCFKCGTRRTKYPHRACDVCQEELSLERWLKCEVRPLEFPLVLQDSDVWFFDVDQLYDYCDEHEVAVNDLRLRIGRRHKPRPFEPSDFWCDDIPEDEDNDPTDDNTCAALANRINAWAQKHIITYEMGPYRPDVAGLEENE